MKLATMKSLAKKTPILFATLFSVWIVVFSASLARAQDVLDIRETVTKSDAESPATKQALFDAAVEKVTFENVRMLIGEEKFERNKPAVENKVLKNSSRYVLSISGEGYKKAETSASMDVVMKLSLKNLRAVLLENGLLYQMEGPPKVLPIVQFVDRVNGRSYGWWYPGFSKDQGWLVDKAETFHSQLRKKLTDIGFYTFMPVQAKMGPSVPEAFRTESIQKADTLFLGEFFKSSIVLKGTMLFRPNANMDSRYIVECRLEAYHSQNGRVLGEIVRSFDTDQGPFQRVVTSTYTNVVEKMVEDLATQLADSWKKGTFGASLINLAVSGKLSPKQMDEFKKTVVLQVRDIKSLRERRIEARRTTFEVDSSVLPQELAQSFRNRQFPRFRVEVEDVTPSGVQIKVEPM